MFVLDGDDRVGHLTITSDDETMMNIREYVGMRLGIDVNSIILSLDNRDLNLEGTCKSNGVVDNSMILVKRKQRITLDSLNPNMSPDDWIAITTQHPELIRQMSLVNPEMATVLETKDVSKLRLYLMQRYFEKFNQQHKQEQEIRAIEADPDNEENQRKIEQAIRVKNIESQRELAYEHMPEAFLQVCMLYVPVSINGHEIAAFVDSGAQSTIMSYEMAKRCNITHLIDERYAGQARGVGTGRILGRIHMAQLKFGNSFYPCSITILEKSDVGFLFGLDMQKRYRCCIDLSQNHLRMETLNGTEVVPFLNEADIEERRIGQGEGKYVKMDERSDDEAANSKDTNTNDSNTTNTSDSNTDNNNNVPTVPNNTADRDTVIRNLMALGFNQQQAILAYNQANGDAELAATILFAMNS